MSNHITKSQDEPRLKVLRLLQGVPHINHREVSETSGASLEKLNFYHKTLVSKDSIKVMSVRKSKNMLAYACLLTPFDIAEKSALSEMKNGDVRAFFNRKSLGEFLPEDI